MYLNSTVNNEDKFLVISPNGISSSFEMMFFNLTFLRKFKNINYELLLKEIKNIINEETKDVKGDNFFKTNFVLNFINQNFKIKDMDLNKIFAIKESFFTKYKIRLLSSLNKDSYEEVRINYEDLPIAKKRNIMKFFLLRNLFSITEKIYHFKVDNTDESKMDKRTLLKDGRYVSSSRFLSSQDAFFSELNEFQKMDLFFELINKETKYSIPAEIKNDFLALLTESNKTFNIIHYFFTYFKEAILICNSSFYFKKREIGCNFIPKDNVYTQEANYYKNDLDYYNDFDVSINDKKQLNSISIRTFEYGFDHFKPTFEKLFLFILLNLKRDSI